ncbi:MAG TPA: hypothetical protein VK399_14525 [Longimicrobiaceae bacterium]|nr:hypothetical protein [Longimicrobiaceae bacterium]
MATLDEADRDALFAEVEAAWVGRRDPSVVDQLAAEHPHLSEELYEFFADLVLGEGEEGELDLPVGAGGSGLAEWLVREGYQIGREAAAAARGGAPPPDAPHPASRASPADVPARSFFTALEDLTDLDGNEIADRIGPNVTLEFLLTTGQYPQIFPRKVREELAARAERVFGISSATSLATFDHVPVRHLKAASRSQAYGAAPPSFRDLLRRCGMTPEQQMYWISMARED